MMVKLDWINKKLSNATLVRIQFWTENKDYYCMDQKYSNGSNLLDLRVWYGGLKAGEKPGVMGQDKMGLQ